MKFLKKYNWQQVITGLVAGLIVCVNLVNPYKCLAANIITVLGTTNRTALITNACHINSITIVGNSVSNIAAVNIGFLDAPGTTNINSANAIGIAITNGGYTNITYAIGGISNYFTNIYGYYETNFTLGKVATTNAVGPAYTAYRNIGLLTVVSNVNNSIFTLTYSALQFNSQGLLVTNSAPMAGTIIMVDYNNAR